MILKKLVLKNFRRFKELELEFPENVIGFIGQNGAGKSTIIEAIGWGLYGTRAARGHKINIRTQGVGPKEVCVVSLVFEVSGTDYHIVRELRGKNAVVEARAYSGLRPDDPIAVRESGVNELVEKLIGLDYKSFFASIFAKQKDLAALGDMRPEERKVAINKLINIDAVDRVRKLASEKRLAVDNELKGMEAMLRDTAELELRIADLEAKSKNESAAAKMAQDCVNQAIEKLNDSKTRFEKVTRLRDQEAELMAEVGKTDAERCEIVKRLKEIKSELAKVDENRKQLLRMEPDLSRLAEAKERKEALELLKVKARQLAKYREDLALQNAQIDDEDKLQQQLEKERIADAEKLAVLDEILHKQKKLKQEEDKLRASLRETSEKLGAIQTAGQTARKRKNQIEKLGEDGPCPVCTRPLAEHYNTVSHQFSEEVKTLLASYARLKKEQDHFDVAIALNRDHQDETQKEKDKLAQLAATQEGKRKRFKDAEDRKEKDRKKAQELMDEIAAIGPVSFEENMLQEAHKRYETLHKMHEHALRLRERVERQPELEKQQDERMERSAFLKEKLAGLAAKLDALNYEPDTYHNAKNLYNRDQDALNTARDTLLEAEKAFISVDKDYKNACREMLEHKKHMARISELRSKKNNLASLVDYFGRFRLHLASRLRPSIAARASELLQITTNGRYASLELDSDYNIMLLDRGASFPLQRFSGGEQDLANLCLRIAISQVIAQRKGKPPVQFIVLDEIFGSQDTGRQQQILFALQKLQSQFRQIFIISHIEAIKDVLPVLIQVSMTSENHSKTVMI